MARYFFDLDEDGFITRDPEGRVLPDMDAARALAIESARSMMRHDILNGPLRLSCHIKINDSEGEWLATVSFGEAVEISGRAVN